MLTYMLALKILVEVIQPGVGFSGQEIVAVELVVWRNRRPRISPQDFNVVQPRLFPDLFFGEDFELVTCPPTDGRDHAEQAVALVARGFFLILHLDDLLPVLTHNKQVRHVTPLSAVRFVKDSEGLFLVRNDLRVILKQEHQVTLKQGLVPDVPPHLEAGELPDVYYPAGIGNLSDAHTP